MIYFLYSVNQCKSVSNKVKKILVATTNPGKIAEIRAMLDLDIDWKSLSDFPNKVIYFLISVSSVNSVAKNYF